jgi:DNA polymerase-3 subunit beta
MDFTIQKETLANGLQMVQNAITQKSSLPILANILLESKGTELKLTATDLDIGICAVIPVISSVDGAITIPAKKFLDIVKSLPEECELEISVKKNNSVSIKTGKSFFKIMGLPKEDFPALPLFEDKDSITIDQKEIKELLNLTDFATSKEDSRHVLTGVLFAVKGEDINLIATDGRRMAVASKKLKTKTLVNKEVIVPLKTVSEVKRLLGEDGEVKIQFGENQVKFVFPTSFVISRIIEGEFPDYKKVIPARSEVFVEAAKEDLLSAVRRVSIFTDQDSQAIKMIISKEKVNISKKAEYLGEAEEEISAKYTGSEEMKIGFNPKYLMDVLRAINETEIKFELNGSNKPGVIRKGEEYTYVVLPMQLPV